MDLSNNKSITTSIIGVVILVVVLGAAYFYFSKNKAEKLSPMMEEASMEENIGDVFADIKTNPFDQPAVGNPFAPPVEEVNDNPFSDVKLNPFE